MPLLNRREKGLGKKEKIGQPQIHHKPGKVQAEVAGWRWKGIEEIKGGTAKKLNSKDDWVIEPKEFMRDQGENS